MSGDLTGLVEQQPPLVLMSVGAIIMPPLAKRIAIPLLLQRLYKGSLLARVALMLWAIPTPLIRFPISALPLSLRGRNSEGLMQVARVDPSFFLLCDCLYSLYLLLHIFWLGAMGRYRFGCHLCTTSPCSGSRDAAQQSSSWADHDFFCCHGRADHHLGSLSCRRTRNSRWRSPKDGILDFASHCTGPLLCAGCNATENIDVVVSSVFPAAHSP